MGPRIMTPEVTVAGVRIPRILVGTSPFIAAGQFGLRSLIYYRRFVMNPRNIAKVLAACFRLGFRGVQLLPYDFVVRGLREAARTTGVEPVIVGTWLPEEPGCLDALLDLGCRLCFVHASVVDRCDPGELATIVDMLREHDMVPGAATHAPLSTVPFLIKHKGLVEALMAPLNIKGFFMGDRDRVVKLYESLGLPLIAKKTLAAGTIPPERALPFVFSHNFVAAAAIGVASVEEAEHLARVVPGIFAAER